MALTDSPTVDELVQAIDTEIMRHHEAVAFLRVRRANLIRISTPAPERMVHVLGRNLRCGDRLVAGGTIATIGRVDSHEVGFDVDVDGVGMARHTIGERAGVYVFEPRPAAAEDAELVDAARADLEGAS